RLLEFILMITRRRFLSGKSRVVVSLIFLAVLAPSVGLAAAADKKSVELAQFIIQDRQYFYAPPIDDDETPTKLPGVEKLRAEVGKLSEEVRKSTNDPELYLKRARFLAEYGFTELAYEDCLRAEKLSPSTKYSLWKAFTHNEDTEGGLWIVHKALKE